MREQCLEAFAVVLGCADTAEAGHAQGDGHGQRAATAVVHPGDLADDLVDGRIGEAIELDLGNRVETGHGQAHGHAQDAGLGQGRVEHAVLAVLGLEAVGDAEHATEPAAVFAEDDSFGVFGENLIECAVERLLHGQLFNAGRFSGGGGHFGDRLRHVLTPRATRWLGIEGPELAPGRRG
ncbi:hypothetical protein PJL18_03079 [Paenarthrobacter nicotinovorans]|nr:hypothetical protein [Paenarthrobacter nicotinovorans]